ncbi:MAG: COX15/CtaA family protein [Legionellaceae bacterium]|nr:COX15/CtaA family protein [Legionellaceae bacterium]
MKILRIISIIALILAFVVVTLGAFTRLTDAGLGCPDWPGCYGKLFLPSSNSALVKAQSMYPKIPIESSKAWTEMAHRYAAGSLVFLICCIIFKSFSGLRSQVKLPWQLSLAIIFLIGFQAALGMWTVTLKLLPIVVMGHLLGGMLIFSCLAYLCWQFSGVSGLNLRQFKLWVNLALFIVFLQIALGGLVSANYAGIACVGFPTCNGQWLPSLDFRTAFDLFPSIGANYQGGLLDNTSRVTLQMVHRLGAIITAIYVMVLSASLFVAANSRFLKSFSLIAIIIVCLQFTLGILNVVYLLPLWAAVAHNGCAALLLATIVSLRYLVSSGGIYARNS